MDVNKNYYSMLEISKSATEKEVKKAYYKLSFVHHPDRGGDQKIFSEITEAYDVLCSKREDYDLRSKWGKFYDETLELINIDIEVDHGVGKSKFNDFRNNEILNIEIEVGENFDGNLEYERWVSCKDCQGTGRDIKSKIIIKGPDGKEKFFDAVDGCDFCSGTGKDHRGCVCYFCFEENNNVIANIGPIRIDKIKENDVVLTSGNNYQKVLKTYKRKYTGVIYDIDIAGIRINGVTPNHKFNIIRFLRRPTGRIIQNKYEILEVCASDLKETDYVMYQSTINNQIDKEIVIPKNRNKIQKLNNILMNDNFIKFISCFIAEGHTSDNRVSTFTFNIEKDHELINFIKWYGNEILKINAVIDTNKSWGNKVVKVKFYSSQLSKFLKEFCGNTAVNKFINKKLIGINDDLLIKTLNKCDGSKNGNSYTYTTVSKKLAYQVFHLSVNIGHGAAIGNEEDPYVDKNGVNHQRVYRIYISYKENKTKKTSKIREKENQKCIKIKSINKRFVKDIYVYNIMVEKTHKYTIEGFLVNNCGGQGVSGGSVCLKCDGKQRILGKQKLVGVELKDKVTKIDAMGHCSIVPGRSGYLLLVKV